jgi:hypothetical protein
LFPCTHTPKAFRARQPGYPISKPKSCQYPGRGYGAGQCPFVQQAEEEFDSGLQRLECKQLRSEVRFIRLEEWKRLEGQERVEQQAALRHKGEERQRQQRKRLL